MATTWDWVMNNFVSGMDGSDSLIDVVDSVMLAISGALQKVKDRVTKLLKVYEMELIILPMRLYRILLLFSQKVC